jgi:MHS family proline/betaine transporter-like MFS transporter
MKKRQILLPALIGNILEFYDYCLYAYFAPIIAKLFFPASKESNSLIATFAVFAVGFLMRPLGALLFGYLGDKFGRKKTLALGIIMMASSTVLVGCLPTYESAGLTATLLLVACRLFQGLAVGGEFSGSLIYMIEHAQLERRGTFSSLGIFSANAGILLSSLAATLMSKFFSEPTLYAWAWRIPFLFGAFLGVLGFYFRLKMPETPTFTSLQAQQGTLKNPLSIALKYKKLSMLKAVFLTILPSTAAYILFSYFPTYMHTYLKLPLNTALAINTCALIINLIFMPLTGMLSDAWGRKPILFIGSVGFLLFSYPLFLLLTHGNIVSIFFAQSCFAILICFANSVVPAILVEKFPTNIRYSAVAFPYNIANGFFGGTAPMVVTYLIASTGNILSPSYYLILIAIPMFLTLFTIKETYRTPLT